MIDKRTGEKMDGSDLLNRWQDLTKTWHFEGEPSNLEKLVTALGYKRSGFRFGEPIEQFLTDNPGAQEAIVSWIEEQLDRGQEFAESLEAEILELEPEDEEGLFSDREDDEDNPVYDEDKSSADIAFEENQ